MEESSSSGFVAAYEKALIKIAEGETEARRVVAAALHESLRPFFVENAALEEISWETSSELNDEGGTYRSLTVRIEADTSPPLRYEGAELDADDFEQVLHEHLWSTFRIDDLDSLTDTGSARVTRKAVLKLG